MTEEVIDHTTRRTADGSNTLWNPVLDEPYQSKHGAVLESMHVFIRSGAQAMDKAHVDILEVGLGKGLNVLLTWIRCLEGEGTASYTALEPYPVPEASLLALGHCNELAWPGLQEPFLALMRGTPDVWREEEDGLRFRRSLRAVQEVVERDAFYLLFFDAFSPRKQPEMWSVEVFSRFHAALRKGTMLVTYCAKRQVRRNMQAAGSTEERLVDPPGKAHMLRATKHADH